MQKAKIILEKYSSLRLLISALLLVIAYFPLLSGKPTVNPDAQLIMPILDRVQSLEEYFKLLFSLETYDIQPVRDLSLYLDWILFKKFSINTFVIHNLIIWLLSCLVVEKLIAYIFKDFEKLSSWIISVLFSIYPLFCATVSWGIARKHILSFLFISLATLYFLKFIETWNKKYSFYFSIFYLLSVFSQPITLLWPFWAIIHLFFFDKNNFFKVQKYFTFTYGIFVSCLLANVHYYRESQIFKTHFEGKTDDPFNIPDKFLAFGHYAYQLIFPYSPSVSYELGHPTVWIGIIIIILFYIQLRLFKISKVIFLSWFSFLFFPLLIITTNPHILSDNYLLVPSLGTLIIIVTALQNKIKIKEIIKFSMTLILGTIWIYKTQIESRFWLDPIKYSHNRGFERRPNCSSALNAARKSYALNESIHKDVKKFLENYECFKITTNTPSTILAYIYLQSYILFYEEDLSLNQRIEALKKYSEINWYPKLVLAALLIKNNRYSESDDIIKEVIIDSDKIKVEPRFDPIIQAYLGTYCNKNNEPNCLNFINTFTKRINTPYM